MRPHGRHQRKTSSVRYPKRADRIGKQRAGVGRFGAGSSHGRLQSAASRQWLSWLRCWLTRLGELPGHYSEVVEATYLSNCESETGDISFYRCTLTKLQNAYTEDEYLAIDTRVAQNPATLPKRVQKIFRRCVRQGAA